MEPEQNNTVVVNGKPAEAKREPFWKRWIQKLRQSSKRTRWIAVGAAIALVIVIGFSSWLLLGKNGIDTEAPVARVAIRAEGFSPATIQIQKGQDVAWVNEDEDVHEVYALQDDAPGLDSTELLATGDTYIYTFEKAGEFNYYDPLNPDDHKGTVIVTE